MSHPIHTHIKHPNPIYRRGALCNYNLTERVITGHEVTCGSCLSKIKKWKMKKKNKKLRLNQIEVGRNCVSADK